MLNWPPWFRAGRSLSAAVVVTATSLAGMVVLGGLQSTPARATTDLEGVDVFSGSGTINWGEVASAGYSFGYARATEGNYLQDTEFQTNWTGMATAKVKPGAYLTVDPSVAGVSQANYFFNLVGPDYRTGDLLPAVDTTLIGEDLEPNCGSEPFPVKCVSQATALSVLNAVVATLKSEFGASPVIYTYTSLWNGLLGDPAGYGANPLWDVQLGSNPPTSTSLPASNWYGNSWALWQYSESGTVSGIPMATDLDQANGTILPTLANFPLSITTTSLPDGQVGDMYSYALAAVGGNPPYTWKLVKGSGKLPDGLKLSKTGVISGTPKQSGSSTFIIEALDTKTKTKPKTQNTTTASFTITVAPAA
ncbi:MAG TPA: GH25 family lysozyme [Acidimicrobiales bacterium]|nr:GH25 family lysozyme [Acidimicrobiales bacterium]